MCVCASACTCVCLCVRDTAPKGNQAINQSVNSPAQSPSSPRRHPVRSPPSLSLRPPPPLLWAHSYPDSYLPCLPSFLASHFPPFHFPPFHPSIPPSSAPGPLNAIQILPKSKTTWTSKTSETHMQRRKTTTEGGGGLGGRSSAGMETVGRRIGTRCWDWKLSRNSLPRERGGEREEEKEEKRRWRGKREGDGARGRTSAEKRVAGCGASDLALKAGDEAEGSDGERFSSTTYDFLKMA